MAIYRANRIMVTPRRRRGFGAFGDFLTDSLMQWYPYVPHVDWGSLQFVPDNGLYRSDVYGWGNQEAPGIVVFRTDAGTVVAMSLQSESAPAPTDVAAMIEQGRADTLAQLSASADIVGPQQMLQAPQFLQAFQSGDPSYALYWERYGAFPSDPAAQLDWFKRAYIGGALEAAEQDRLDSERGWEGFFNQSFPMLAASFVVGGAIGAWAAATGAPAYGPVAAAQDLIQQAGVDLPWGVNPADAGTIGYEPDPGFEQGVFDASSGMPVIGYEPDPGFEQGVFDASSSAPTVGYEPDPGFEQGTFTVSSASPTIATDPWESAVAESSIQNAALAEASGQVPSGTLASVVGDTVANAALTDAQAILAAGNPPIIGAGAAGAGAASGGGVTTSQVLQTAGQVLPVIGAGIGLVKTLTASDAMEVPTLPGTSSGALPGTGTGSTLVEALSKFPWWLVVAGVAAASGN